MDFQHQSKKRQQEKDLKKVLPLPIVFKVSDEVLGPLKDANQIPVFNGVLNTCLKRVLIYDLPSANVS